jgi:hypothetical protein
VKARGWWIEFFGVAHVVLLRGTWFARSKEFLARQRGEHTLPMQFATTFDVKLTPLPCLLDLTEDQRHAHCRRVVGEIQAKAEADNKEKGHTPMTVEAILAQDPHSKPASTDRSPAPFVHATDDSTETEFRAAYRADTEVDVARLPNNHHLGAMPWHRG